MISEKYIMDLVRVYANSPAGKKKIKKITGITYMEENPSQLLVKQGEAMKRILYEKTHALIKSITLEDIIVGCPYQDENGNWQLEISFRDGALHRDSLDDMNYPEGLHNIVLLFAKGYHAENYAYGLWRTGHNLYGSDYKSIRSRKSRDSNDFLDKAVEDFNHQKCYDIVAKAELLGEYKECSKK